MRPAVNVGKDTLVPRIGWTELGYVIPHRMWVDGTELPDLGSASKLVMHLVAVDTACERIGMFTEIPCCIKLRLTT